MSTEKATSPKTSATEETNPVAEKTSEEYVKYVGPASRREITVEQWAAIGATVPVDSNWTFGNGFKLPKKDFPPEALKYLLSETRQTGSKSFQVVSD